MFVVDIFFRGKHIFCSFNFCSLVAELSACVAKNIRRKSREMAENIKKNPCATFHSQRMTNLSQFISFPFDYDLLNRRVGTDQVENIPSSLKHQKICLLLFQLEISEANRI